MFYKVKHFRGKMVSYLFLSKLFLMVTTTMPSFLGLGKQNKTRNVYFKPWYEKFANFLKVFISFVSNNKYHL